MKNEEYKKLSISEFTKAAGRYESNHAGIYEMCKKDYPDILEELEKEPDVYKRQDETLVPVNGEYVKEAKIGSAIMDADVFISLTHFKGHETAGFGGTIKNIGMGCGSRAGKMEQHCEGKPSVATEACIGCGACGRICAHGAPVITDHKAKIDHDKCVGCGRCRCV